MILSLIIPAYNEEEAIADTIRQCLKARSTIVDQTPLDEVEFLVVSDGSTDATTQIASEFEPEIRLISYPDNRGYGAAITIGFQQAKGDLLAFMDADGTINPVELVGLVRKLQETDADICLGSRLGPDSHMPPIRWLGNLFFRTLVQFLSNRRTSDVASGIRVLRRECLSKIYPLPTDLSYTPAMSCRAHLDPKLEIVETPISYSERVGRSKLSVIRDGVNFLRVILDIGISFRPFKLLAIPGIVLIAISLIYGVPLWIYYLQEKIVPEDRIYRILFIIVSFNCGVLYLGLGALLENIPRMLYDSGESKRVCHWLERFFAPTPLFVAAISFWALTLISVLTSLYEYLASGKISVHWSWTALAAFFAILGTIILAFAIAEYAIRAMRNIATSERPNIER